jgi:DNA-binding beta-propeller fold protein YncE
MLKNGFVYISLIMSLYLLSACAPSVTPDKKRFFFPPAPAEPKIEYIQAYFSDHDLKPGKLGFLTEYVLGDTRPQAILSSPTDVASDGKGRVFVADAGTRQVVVLDLVNHKHRLLSSPSLLGGAERSFGIPFSVTVADDGKLYVSDIIAKSVVVFDAKEKYLFTLNDPDMERPTAVAVDMAHKITYVVDTAKHEVVMFDLQGERLGSFGGRGPGAGQFNFPTDVDVDEQGHIYVLDSLNARVQVFDSSGEFLRMFGERGTEAGSFQMPKNLAVDNFGQVYVTDALAHKVVIFSREGDLLLRIGGKSVVKKGVSPGGFYLPRGIDVDPDGGLWVVDSLNRMVHNFQFLTPKYLQEHPISQGVVPAQ